MVENDSHIYVDERQKILFDILFKIQIFGTIGNLWQVLLCTHLTVYSIRIADLYLFFSSPSLPNLVFQQL